MGHTKTSERKKDHIDLAFKSAVDQQDERFYYEPLFAAHPEELDLGLDFLGKHMKAPIWVSSMTGGTKEARVINRNLARVCNEYGLGMGLGSCRIILHDDEYLDDFKLRNVIGDSPFYANLGIAQLEELIGQNKLKLAADLVDRTETDGLIIHVNPLQEWLQPEGDRFNVPPIETIKRVLDLEIPVVVKEVGQGFGPRSLQALCELPLAGIEFGAHGGTNFSQLEMNRNDDLAQQSFQNVVHWGHSAEEMVDFYNAIDNNEMDVIISGGITNYLQGYYLINKINTNAVYGQASAFLRHARGDYSELEKFVQLQIEGLKLASAYLTVR